MAHKPLHVSLVTRTLTAAGSTQSDATAIPLTISVAIATGNAVVGLRLPSASKRTAFFLINLGPIGGFGGLNIWPASGDAINALSADAAFVMPALTACMIVAVSSSQWYTMPRVPS